MRISIITLFPDMFPPILNTSILGRAQKKGKVTFELINLRDFGVGTHKTVDDKPYGGGAGMLLKANVLAKALQSVKSKVKSERSSSANKKIILTSASGSLFKQHKARELSTLDHLVIICGHYEGVDQRFIEKYVDEEISIGEYVLTGGELPSMVIADAVTRLIPGVLEKPEATENESYSISNEQLTVNNLLEHPQYTRPDVFEGLEVPKELRSGNHAKIAEWKIEQSKIRTAKSNKQ